MGPAHQARLSDRPSQVRLWRSATRHLLHHRAEGDSANLVSSPKTKTPIAPATATLVSAFRLHHLSDAPVRDARSVTSHPCPRRQTPLNRLVSLARALLPSPGLNRAAQPYPGGENSSGSATDTYEFSYPSLQEALRPPSWQRPQPCQSSQRSHGPHSPRCHGNASRQNPLRLLTAVHHKAKRR